MMAEFSSFTMKIADGDPGGSRQPAVRGEQLGCDGGVPTDSNCQLVHLSNYQLELNSNNYALIPISMLLHIIMLMTVLVMEHHQLQLLSFPFHISENFSGIKLHKLELLSSFFRMKDQFSFFQSSSQ